MKTFLTLALAAFSLTASAQDKKAPTEQDMGAYVMVFIKTRTTACTWH